MTDIIRNENKRYDNLDLMKCLGILFVISLHVPLWNVDFITGERLTQYIQYGFRIISEGVPVFLFVNGFLLLKKDDLDVKKHYIKTLRIFVLLVLWGIILTIAGTQLAVPKESVSLTSLTQYILHIQVGAEYTGVLWYLQGLIAVYLVFPVIWKAYKIDFNLFKWMFVAISFFSVGVGIIVFIRDFAGCFFNVALLTDLIDFLNRFNPFGSLWYFFYFCYGGIAGKYYSQIKKHRRVLASMGALSWPVAFIYGICVSRLMDVVYNPAFNYGSIFMSFFVLGMLAASFHYKTESNILNKLISNIGRNTLGIYLIHFVFIFIVCHFTGGVDTASERILAYCFVVVCSHLSTLLISNIPIMNNIMKI